MLKTLPSRISLALLMVLSLVACTSTSSGAVGANKSVSSTPVLEDLGRSGYPFASTEAQIREFSEEPVEPYYVGPGDVLRLKSGNNEFPDEELKVSPDSKISFTNVGEIVVEKRDVKSLEKEINEKLKRFYANVECRLVLVSALNMKVALLGAVKSPGIIKLESDMSLIDVIADAGGFENPPGENTLNLARTRLLCRIIRENGKTIWIDLKAILFQNAVGYNIRLRNNDILYVFRQ